MKVLGDFVGPPRSTDKTTQIISVKRGHISGIDTIKNNPEYRICFVVALRPKSTAMVMA